MKSGILISWLCLMVCFGHSFAAESNLSEADEIQASKAFQTYWQGFEDYERNIGIKTKNELELKWQEAREDHDRESSRLLSEQMESLQRAAKEYRKQLSTTPNADNRPHVLLNLAMVQKAVSEFKAKLSDLSGATIARDDALSAVSEVIQSFPGFIDIEKAMYLRAILLSAAERTEDAQDAWNFLAQKGRGIHAVHAHIAVGDRAFQSNDVKAATASYRKAMSVLRAIPDQENLERETARLQYRLAWSAFRSGEFPLVLTNARDILIQARVTADRANSQKIRKDAIDLVASTLYEMNDYGRSIRFLKDKELQSSSAAIGLSLIEKLSASALHSQAAAYGAWIGENYPFAPEIPKTLTLTALALKELKKTSSYIATLEKLSALLPSTSLWRSRNRAYPERIQQLETDAMNAAEVVAAYHYENALASGSSASFAKSSVHYQLLIDQSPNGPNSNRWLLRIGHCQYFSEHLSAAEKIYESLVNEHSVSADILEVASYHLVLTKEKLWRQSLTAALGAGKNPSKTPAVLSALEGLRSKADSFANKYPGQTRSIDLLLVAAGAYRDADLFETANNIWQRVLVAGGTAAQRGTAIRGIVFAAIKRGPVSDVVEKTERFLNLEDWRVLGIALASELKGILSASCMDAAEQLAAAGKTLEAGVLLTRIAQTFKDIPERAKIYRDGGYHLALAGAWMEANIAAQGFLDEDLQTYRDDMMYLKARSLEYQLKMRAAAQSYLELGQAYPRYSKSALAFERAERLAQAEDDIPLAARAAEGSGDIASNQEAKLAAYTRAGDYRLAAGDIPGALAMGKKRMGAAKNEEQKMRAQIFIARIGIQTKKDVASLKALEAIAKRIDAKRSDIGEDAYRGLAAECHYLLGIEAQAKFDDFNIFERKGTILQNVAEKSKMFESLATEFSRSAAANFERFSAESRYRLADSADRFADEVSAIPARAGESLAQRSFLRLNDNVTRLRNLAKSTHTANVLSRNRLGAANSKDEWVQKSSRRLNVGERDDGKQSDAAPSTVQLELPFEWNL